MSESLLSEQETKDKKMIDRGIVESKRFIESKKFDSANLKLSQISPASRRLNYKQYDIAILYAFLMTKQNKWKEAKPYVQSATRLKPDDPVPWKLLIQVESNIGTDNTMISTLKRALETSRPDGSLLQFIGPYLKKFDDEELVDNYIRVIEIMPNGIDLPVVSFIPEIPKTLELRLRMLKKSASTNQESCSQLIHFLLSEDDPFKAMEYSKMLPEDHPDRLYVEALIGDDPIGSARKHLKTGDKKFFDFLRAVDSHNLADIRAQISLIAPFASGWAYLSSLEKDPKSRIIILSDASSRFPNCINFIKLLAEAKEEIGDIDGSITTIKKSIFPVDSKLGSEMLIRLFIRQGRCKEAASLVKVDKSLVVSDADRASIELELYKEDGDINRLKSIINDFPLLPELAGIKAEAAWSLRGELGDECEPLFQKALECDPRNGECYLMYGKWQLEFKRDEEKASVLLQKASELGFVDEDSSELLTRNLIKEEKIDEALAILKRVDTKWSHFRAALIHQRKGEHEEAAKEFQLDLRFNPDRVVSWSAIGHEYVVLGRAMAARSVADHLREIGSPDLPLEYEICSIFGRPIKSTEKVEEMAEFERNPIQFYSYLQQTIDTVRNLKRLGRTESARIILQRIKPNVALYAKKWDSLATVLKVCGDFYVESSLLTNEEDSNDSDEAVRLFRKRCEVEKRAESFIDLAHSLQIQKRSQKLDEKNRQIEESIVVLKGVLKTFPDHAGLWTALGVSYALASKYPFACHCLCVAAKLATDMEQARSYACCANVALLVDDMKLLDEALEAARSANPYDPDVWQMIASTRHLKDDGVGQYDENDSISEKAKSEANSNAEEAIIAFHFGSSDVVTRCLPGLCLKSGRLVEALGYSLISGDDEAISNAFEALGKYDLALMYEKDEARRQRLLVLAGKDSEVPFKKFPNINLYKSGKFKEAASRFNKKKDFYSKLAAAICYSKSGDVGKSIEIFERLRKVPHFAQQVEKIMLQVIPPPEEVDSPLAQTNPELFFISQLRSCARLDAAKNMIKRFPSDLSAISIYVAEAVRARSVDDFALTKARALYSSQPGLKSLTLLTICLVRMNENEEAVKNLQLLYILNPSAALKLRNVLSAVLSKIQLPH